MSNSRKHRETRYLAIVAIILVLAACGAMAASWIPWHGLALKEEPWHTPASEGDWSKMKLLLDQGLPVDAEDENGDTPLYYAVTHDQIDLAQKLVDRGANVRHHNHWGAGLDSAKSVTLNPKTLAWVDKVLK